MRRHGAELDELASVPAPAVQAPFRLTLAATGARPTLLQAAIVDSAGSSVSAEARDDLPALQRRGDPGVLATAETLFPSERNPVLPALGNLHLLPWAVQEGQAFMATPTGAGGRRRDTQALYGGLQRDRGDRDARPRRARAAVVAATTGRPVPGGAQLRVASDIPARASVELARSPRFRRPRTDPHRAHRRLRRRLDDGRARAPSRPNASTGARG